MSIFVIISLHMYNFILSNTLNTFFWSKYPQYYLWYYKRKYKENSLLCRVIKLHDESVHVLLEQVKEGYETETTHLHVKTWCYFELKPKWHVFVIFSYFLVLFKVNMITPNFEFCDFVTEILNISTKPY